MYDVEWAPGVTYRACGTKRSTSCPVIRCSSRTWTCSAAFRQRAEREARTVLDAPGGRTVQVAYDWCLKASHAFNVLDARGAISVSQRAGMILAIRKLACAVAERYVEPPASAFAWCRRRLLQHEDGFGRSQEEALAAPAGEEPDLWIGLALIDREMKRESSWLSSWSSFPSRRPPPRHQPYRAS